MPSEESLDAVLELAMSHDCDVAALELFATYLQYRPDDMDARYQYGEYLRIVGRKKEAEAEFLTVLSSQSKYTGRLIHTRLAILYDNWGKHDLSEKYWQRACNDDAAPGWAWIMRGANLAACGQFEEAETCHRKATRIDNCDQDEAFLNLGYVMRAQRNYIGAEIAFRKALALSPDYAEAVEGLQSLNGLVEALNSAKALLAD